MAFSVNQIAYTRVGREGRERDTWGGGDGVLNFSEHEIVKVKLTLL